MSRKPHASFVQTGEVARVEVEDDVLLPEEVLEAESLAVAGDDVEGGRFLSNAESHVGRSLLAQRR